MIDEVLEALARMDPSGQGVALASLVDSSGSIPMSDRAKMVVDGAGAVIGTIGGGCLEAEIVTVAREVLDSGVAQLTRYTMTAARAGAHGLNCGGTVAIYTERVDPGAGGSELFAAVRAARAARVASVLATCLDDGGGDAPQRWLLRADGDNRGPGLAEAGATAHAERMAPSMFGRDVARLVELATGGRLFLEPFSPPPILYVFGGGHVGEQICRAASAVGFLVTIIDDRPLFANPERHPEAVACIADDIEAVFERLPFDGQTYVIAATRGHEHDEAVVEHAIRTGARYIGMLGSERKKLMLWKRILGRGADPQRLGRVSAPIGLNIGADTPEEIAVSVVAELIQLRRGGAVRPWKTKPRTEKLAQGER